MNHCTDHWKDQMGPIDGDISTNIINILILHCTDKIAMRIDNGAN
jgi:hypothetical protein